MSRLTLKSTTHVTAAAVCASDAHAHVQLGHSRCSTVLPALVRRTATSDAGALQVVLSLEKKCCTPTAMLNANTTTYRISRLPWLTVVTLTPVHYAASCGDTPVQR